MKTSVIKICAALLCFSFVYVKTFAQSDEALKQKIETINKEMAKNMLDGKMSDMSHYTSDAISMPSNAPMAQGIDAIKKSNEMMMQSGAKFKSFDTKIMQVKSNGNQVTEIGTYQMSMTMPGMAKDYEDHGKYLTIWEKQPDGTLKVKVEMWNSDVNQMSEAM